MEVSTMQKLDFSKFKALLESKQAELASGVRFRDEMAIQKTADLLEEVQLAADRELAIRTRDRESRLSREVRAALDWIGDGSYGVCLRCEDLISPRRLEAVPWASYCVRCQEAIDRDGVETAAPRALADRPLLALAA